MRQASSTGPPGDGCDVAPHCLECPLPACKYDDLHYYQQWRADNLRNRIIAMRARGDSIREIALVEQLSERTIYKAIDRKA